MCFSKQIFDLGHSEVPTEFPYRRLGRPERFICERQDGVTRFGPKESEVCWFPLDGDKAAKVEWTVKKSECESGAEFLPSLASHRYTALLENGQLVCKHEDEYHLVSTDIDTTAWRDR